eukprot:GILI01006516.1.p1 GENE.GILI01006516.1~~GILI01006516.1.p1  ORF type:complete len:498 (-),score=165.16 GILI01006516.1:503-1996(-)
MAISMAFPLLGACVHAVLIVLYGIFTYYDFNTEAVTLPEGNGQYSMFQDVHVMIFIGFGFLMTFLGKNSFTSTGHSLYIAAIACMWGILCEGFWERAMHHVEEGEKRWHHIPINLNQLVNADFGAGAVLITFGALIGRVSITQMVVVALIEVCIFMIIINIQIFQVKVADIGGSMAIHMFGAYFGLACSFVIEKLNPSRVDKDESKNGSTHDSDVTAMIGTLFLWCFWPSFNSYFASNDARANRGVINTYLSLMCSVSATFIICVLVYKGKLRMVEVQNSTIAGGVAIGTCADMAVEPFGAMLIGTCAGTISVLGYAYLSPYLNKRIGLKDTCGIHNLHGMPGLLGGIAGIIASAAAGTGGHYANFDYTRFPSGVSDGMFLVWPDRANHGASRQAANQLAFLGICLGFGIVGGCLTGAIISLFPVIDKMYDDAEEWELEAEHEHHVDHHHHHDHTNKNVEMTTIKATGEHVAANGTVLKSDEVCYEPTVHGPDAQHE